MTSKSFRKLAARAFRGHAIRQIYRFWTCLQTDPDDTSHAGCAYDVAWSLRQPLSALALRKRSSPPDSSLRIIRYPRLLLLWLLARN